MYRNGSLKTYKKLFLACQHYVSETNRILLSMLKNASNRACLMAQWISQCGAWMNIYL